MLTWSMEFQSLSTFLKRFLRSPLESIICFSSQRVAVYSHLAQTNLDSWVCKTLWSLIVMSIHWLSRNCITRLTQFKCHFSIIKIKIGKRWLKLPLYSKSHVEMTFAWLLLNQENFILGVFQTREGLELEELPILKCLIRTATHASHKSYSLQQIVLTRSMHVDHLPIVRSLTLEMWLVQAM